MKPSRLYRFVLLALAGGMLFQTANVSCQKQVAQSFGISFAEALAPALVEVITAALEGAITTSTGT